MGMRAIFQKKGRKRGEKKGKIFEKCAKSENILKNGSLMRATISSMKQLEYALRKGVVCKSSSSAYNQVI